MYIHNKILMFLVCRVRTHQPIRLFSEVRNKWVRPDGYKTGVKIYSRFVKDSVDFVTREKKVCSWYCCGPTVYDSAHIGHACCYIRFDIIRRILENFHGIDVLMLMSVTDIDDKIINKASQECSNFKEVAVKYEREFFEDMNLLGVSPPTLTLRVSEHVSEIIAFTSRILDNGKGYVAQDGSVYFAVDRYPDYGKLSPPQERETAEGKHSNLDFALWKAAKPGEPFWESPWGKGRPGWHIECSTMASKYFGSNLDLHSGGIDLLFPHHENEEAQSCAYHNCKQWVNYWIHSGHLHLGNGVKMSKSLKNTVLVRDFLEEYSADHLRTLCMLVPYRNGIEYSPEVMRNAVAVYAKIVNFLSECEASVQGTLPRRQVDDGLLLKELHETREIIIRSLSNDFNTAGAMSQLIKLISRTSSEMNSSHQVVQSTSLSITAIANFVERFLTKLGFFNSTQADTRYKSFDQILDASLRLRSSVRNVALSKTFSLETVENKKVLLNACDKLRNDFKNAGIEIKDRGDASTWNITSCKAADRHRTFSK